MKLDTSPAVSKKLGWSLDAKCWTRLSVNWSKSSARQVILIREQAGDVTENSGVYVICASPPATSLPRNMFKHLYNAVYVGQAVNLRTRFNKHVTGYGNVPSARALFGSLDFWFIEVPKDDLDHAESVLIDALGPVANKINGPTIQARLGAPVPAN